MLVISINHLIAESSGYEIYSIPFHSANMILLSHLQLAQQVTRAIWIQNYKHHHPTLLSYACRKPLHWVTNILQTWHGVHLYNLNKVSIFWNIGKVNKYFFWTLFKSTVARRTYQDFGPSPFACKNNIRKMKKSHHINNDTPRYQHIIRWVILDKRNKPQVFRYLQWLWTLHSRLA